MTTRSTRSKNPPAPDTQNPATERPRRTRNRDSNASTNSNSNKDVPDKKKPKLEPETVKKLKEVKVSFSSTPPKRRSTRTSISTSAAGKKEADSQESANSGKSTTEKPGRRKSARKEKDTTKDEDEEEEEPEEESEPESFHDEDADPGWEPTKEDKESAAEEDQMEDITMDEEENDENDQQKEKPEIAQKTAKNTGKRTGKIRAQITSNEDEDETIELPQGISLNSNGDMTFNSPSTGSAGQTSTNKPVLAMKSPSLKPVVHKIGNFTGKVLFKSKPVPVKRKTFSGNNNQQQSTEVHLTSNVNNNENNTNNTNNFEDNQQQRAVEESLNKQFSQDNLTPLENVSPTAYTIREHSERLTNRNAIEREFQAKIFEQSGGVDLLALKNAEYEKQNQQRYVDSNGNIIQQKDLSINTGIPRGPRTPSVLVTSQNSRESTPMQGGASNEHDAAKAGYEKIFQHDHWFGEILIFFKKKINFRQLL